MAKRRKLSLQRERLVDFYFGAANFNKMEALRLAGYSPKSQYHRVFDYPAIAQEIERRHRAIREKYEVDYDRVAAEIAKVAFSNVLDYGFVDQETGDFILDFRRADAAALAAIGEVTTETYVEGRGEEARAVKRVRVKPHSKMAALEALMRHAGLSKDKAVSAVADLTERLAAGLKRVGADSRESESGDAADRD